ncbi:antitoxin VapB family protein [Halomarina salina]|uniref:Antitoxin VapB family protein n=1 Tax=Halomarina salina TaxID=1872699 RepID=A0ABD5RUQ3_9EURY|nr:antitoxin VapB family protein [Halomarina salina]
MSKSIRVSEEYHAFLKAHKREGETMEETLRRLTGGPDPELVAGILSDDMADEIENRLARKRESDADSKDALRDRLR